MTNCPIYDRNYIFPPEWYPQGGVQLTWPHADTDWKEYLADITITFIELAKTIVRYEKLLVVAQRLEEVKALLRREINVELFKNIVFCRSENNDTWARDHAFITLVPTDHTSRHQASCCLLDFRFNGWGGKFASDLDNAINRNIYYQGVLRGEYEDHTDFVLEGGAIETDGKGTVFTTSSCLLVAPNRNQPLGRREIEARLKNALRAERIVWIDHGRLVGDDTDGHIDTIVRTSPGDTLLYVGCDNPEDEQYNDFQALEEQLRTLRTLEGKPYRLLKLPMPDAIYDDDKQRLPATYANFLILNGALIYPTYKQPKNDRRAAEVLRQAFPDRQLIPIDACTVIKQHGSLHCLTMQYPPNVIQEIGRMSDIF